MIEDDVPLGLAGLVVPLAGAVEATGDPFEPYRLVDPEGAPVLPVTVFLADLQACGRSALTQRSYSMALLRWFRFLWAAGVPWDQATRVEARDFVRWVQVAGQAGPAGTGAAVMTRPRPVLVSRCRTRRPVRCRTRPAGRRPASWSGPLRAGAVAAPWRYPVKSMMGEELNSCEVTGRGLLGDRQSAVVDRATGKVGGAKNPRKWRSFFDFRAAYAQPPQAAAAMPPVRITLPDGTVVSTGHGDLEQVLSRAFGRDVAVQQARPGDGSPGATAEEYWPDMAGVGVYASVLTDGSIGRGDLSSAL